ncbi:UNVERIFIED_CONTAM: Cell division cycle 5-like protein, partial [Eudyptes robustus]
RVVIKGGVWKNTEDEILKAAIMKYGKNQWSRIASLLHRKSAKQCKARWYEWLDPKIKKTEWSREEDEKLLNLAKIMPTQWRTIAPIVGRTAAQCLERYEQLLDEAQRRAEGLDVDESLSEAKKLKPGDVDPTPETKPARPDPIDMDEDELEMLSEARARLANTQGKKAKRKAREKQLAEARRLATLQKKRELKAAGIVLVNNFKNKKKPEVDYNAEIPFEKHVPAGFHDPSEDRFDKKPVNSIEEKRRDAVEFEERKKDREKLKRKKEEDAPTSIFDSKKPKLRSKLTLPQPQVSENDLESIVKMGQMTESVRSIVDENPSSALLHDISKTEDAFAPKSTRTMTTNVDTVARAADDLLAIMTADTPLKGGFNTPLHSANTTEGLTDKRYIETPRTERRVGGTLEEGHGMSTKLRNLPNPTNDFELVLPEEEEEEEGKLEDEWIEDAENRDARAQALEGKRKERERQRRSEPFKRELPLPEKINAHYRKKNVANTDLARADNLIKDEIHRMMEWDVLGKAPSDVYDPEMMAQASALIKMEMEEGPKLDLGMWNIIKECADELICYDGRYTRLSSLGRREQVEALTAKFNVHREWMGLLSKKTAKIEKKVSVLVGGYLGIQKNLLDKIHRSQKQKEKLLLELKTFQRLEENEDRAMVKRVHTLNEELSSVESYQRELQETYSKLQQKKWALEQFEIKQ